MENIVKKVQLFCLPFAGGSASSYLAWNKYLKNSICIIPVQLAGRGERFSDKSYDSFEEIVDECFLIIKSKIQNDNLQYALLGHSMGSWIVYEICRRIYKTDMRKPLHVFFSGNRAPYFEYQEKKIHKLPDTEFIDEILRYGGSDRNLLEDSTYGKIFLNILRNDFRLIENYVCDKEIISMDCDVSVFNGIQDDIPEAGLLAWSSCTQKNCSIYNFEGGHFFLFERADEVTKELKKMLNEMVLI